MRRLLLALVFIPMTAPVQAEACSDHDLDHVVLDEAVTWIEREAFYLNVLLIQHCGGTVVEKYYNGYGPEKLHDMQSATKTFTGILVGIALNQGIIKSIDQPVVELLPNYADLLTEEKTEITVRHLLEMTSGLKWIDFGPERSFEKQAAAEDSAAFILGEPLLTPPGETWFYSTGSSHLLSAIVRYSSGMSTADFADKFLFGPLEFSEYVWRTHADGVHEGGWQLYLGPLDMLKFGQMLHDGGEWNGRRIVSQQYVDAATEFQNQTTYGASGYGYQMWVETDFGPEDLAGARGWGGQNILIAQDLHTVIVTNGSIDHPREMGAAAKKLISEFVTPSHD